MTRPSQCSSIMAERRPGMPPKNPAETGLGWGGQASFTARDARTQPLQMSRSKAHVELGRGSWTGGAFRGRRPKHRGWNLKEPPWFTFLGVHCASNEGHGGQRQGLESKEA